MKKKFLAIILCIVIALTLCGCREVTRVKFNVSKEADNFNVMRKLTVMNARTDTIMLELTGRFSLKNNSTNELVVIIETEKDVYKVNYIYLTENVLYVVEDMSGADVSPYHYELNFLPQMIGMYDITINK